MGKKSKDKKTGKGAQKTAAKTDKKLSTKMKKELQKLGEDDIEALVKQIEADEKKRLQVTEALVQPPSRRVNFTFIAHPDKEQLILFGGEFFNGQKTTIYNDLFFYNIPTNTWTVLKAPGAPPPRCGHQMVATSTNKGQLWLFGGEFASASQAQFFHYRDLWVFHMNQKQWEKILSGNGPSARSGHRMVYTKKKLLLFGGFHDNLRDYKYFNDLYMFNMETYQWVKLEPQGAAPAPRSACCMVALNDGRVLVYGGYSKERVKKDVDKGRIFTDSYLLTPEKNDSTGLKWKWVNIKLSGVHFTPRCSMTMTSTANNMTAYCYGGVFDVEDEENLASVFYNDFYSLDLDKFSWRSLATTSKKQQENPKIETLHIEEPRTVADDGVFKVTIGPAAPSTSQQVELVTSFQPSPRINCGLAVKHSHLYLYGGIFEDGDRQITYNDFYSIDIKKNDEWKVLIADDQANLDWVCSSDSEESEKSDEESEDSETDSQ